MEDKFSYKSEEEFQIIESQCEVCTNYNSGRYSDACPKEKFDEIKNNLITCENKKLFSILD